MDGCFKKILEEEQREVERRRKEWSEDFEALLKKIDISSPMFKPTLKLLQRKRRMERCEIDMIRIDETQVKMLLSENEVEESKWKQYDFCKDFNKKIDKIYKLENENIAVKFKSNKIVIFEPRKIV